MFQDVSNRVPSSICVRCRKNIEVDTPIIEVFSCSGVGNGKLHVTFPPEAAHVSCSKSLFNGPDLPRRKIVPSVGGFILPRRPEYQCVRCGKQFNREDRLTTAYRADTVDEKGLRVSDEYECCHIDCSDPKLLGEGSVCLLVG